MAYTENMPEAADNPSQSQPLIKNNFNDISTALSVNHVGFNNADQGKHNFLQMPEQSSAPAISANEMGLYTKESSLTSVAEMFIRRESNGTEIEFTSFLGAANGWTRLPSGILLKWGSGSGGGTHTTDFPTGGTIPKFTAAYSAQVTTADSSSNPDTFAYFRGFVSGGGFVTGISVYGARRTSTSATDSTYNYLVIGI